MKIIVRDINHKDNTGSSYMIDTNSETIRLWTNYSRDYSKLICSGFIDSFYEGTHSKVRAMFEAIVAAEKRGDKYFEINEGIINEGMVEDD